MGEKENNNLTSCIDLKSTVKMGLDSVFCSVAPAPPTADNFEELASLAIVDLLRGNEISQTQN